MEHAVKFELSKKKLAEVCPEIKFSPELIAAFADAFAFVELPKGEFLIEDGRRVNHFYFLLEGCVRFFHLSDGNEITTSFFVEGDLFTGTSFVSREPSDEYCEALENLKLLRMSYDTLQQFYVDYLEMNVFGRKMAEFFVIQMDKRMHHVLAKNAKEKFERFMASEEAQLLDRVPHKYISSYLGFTKETLSRLRRGSY